MVKQLKYKRKLFKKKKRNREQKVLSNNVIFKGYEKIINFHGKKIHSLFGRIMRKDEYE